MVVPGSGLAKKQAEEEGLDQIFTSAGIQWREPWLFYVSSHEFRSTGRVGKHCASTSNRNFEGRQGFGGENSSS